MMFCLLHIMGEATARIWTPTALPTNRWPEAAWEGGFWEEQGGGGGGRGAFAGGGGSRWGDLGGTCPQGQVLVHRRLPLPPLALPLTVLSTFLPKTALEPAENGQMKGNSGYSTHAARHPRAKVPSRAL